MKSLITTTTLLAFVSSTLAGSAVTSQNQCNDYGSCQEAWKSNLNKELGDDQKPELYLPSNHNNKVAKSTNNIPSHPILGSKENLEERLLPPPMSQKDSEDGDSGCSRSPSLEAVLRGTHDDASRSEKAAKMIEAEHQRHEESKHSAEVQKFQSAKELGATQTNDIPVPSGTLSSVSKFGLKCCSDTEDMKDVIFEGRRSGLTSWIMSKPCTMIRDGRTITYTYTYIRRDCPDILVVVLVLSFLVAIVLVELLQKLIDTSRGVFGSRSKSVSLEADPWNCECGHESLPPYDPQDKTFHKSSILSPVWEEWADEKSGKFYASRR